MRRSSLSRPLRHALSAHVCAPRVSSANATPVSSRFSTAAARLDGYDVATVPTIDLSPLQHGEAPSWLVDDVADACAKWGFFQVVNHGVDPSLRARAESQQRAFWALPVDVKRAMKRSAGNSRGWYDDELTKQRHDWKEGLDFGNTPAADWTLRDDDERNGNLDGYNRFPPPELLPAFRPTLLEYYDELAGLAARLTRVFSLGLGMPADFFESVLNRRVHSSYLRINYYPQYTGPDRSQLSISPHKDAGFLTVLQQDEGCHSLQVRSQASPDTWETVVPERDAFTINTGDMAQVWSNNQYKAPEHRVLTHPTKERCSVRAHKRGSPSLRSLPRH